MQKGISADSQIHISIAFLIKAMIGISLLIASYYQIQMKFASIDSTLNDLQSKVTVLTASVEGMEQEQKSLLQKIGLKK